MRLEPGPIPDLAPDFSSLAPDPPEFQNLANDTLADLPSLDDQLGTLVDSLAEFDAPAEFDVIDVNLDTSDEGLNELSAFSTSVHVDNADSEAQLSQGFIQQLQDDVPGEVWGPVPEPMSSTQGAPSHPGENGPTTLTLKNLTAPGDPNFYSGDSFSLTVQIDSGGGNFDSGGKPISLTRTQNGVSEPELPIGSTDQFGRLVYESTFNDSSIGDRTFGCDPPGYGTNPLVGVTVKPGPRPAGGTGAGALSATLENLTSGDATTFHPGDIWREIITGAAGQPVYLDQVKNGVDQGELFVGSTDQSGSLLIAGTITAAQLGTYSETFRVGTARVPGSIQFSVSL